MVDLDEDRPTMARTLGCGNAATTADATGNARAVQDALSRVDKGSPATSAPPSCSP